MYVPVVGILSLSESDDFKHSVVLRLSLWSWIVIFHLFDQWGFTATGKRNETLKRVFKFSSLLDNVPRIFQKENFDMR